MTNTKMGAPKRLPQGDNCVALFRARWHLSQAQAGKALGLSRSAVGMYETGANPISPQTEQFVNLLNALFECDSATLPPRVQAILSTIKG